MKCDRCGGCHTFEVEVVIRLHVVEVECAPDFLRMCVLFVRDVLVVQLGEECLLSLQVVGVALLHAVHLLVSVPTIPLE